MINKITIRILVQIILYKWLIYLITKIRESDFDGSVSKRDKLQDFIINHLKLEVHDTYKKGEK